MRKLLAVIALLLAFTAQLAVGGYVRGHYRSNGTYVNGYYRSDPGTYTGSSSYPSYNYYPQTSKSKTSSRNKSAYIYSPPIRTSKPRKSSTRKPTGSRSITDYASPIHSKTSHWASDYSVQKNSRGSAARSPDRAYASKNTVAHRGKALAAGWNRETSKRIRSEAVVKRYLRSLGRDRVPPGYEVDHIVPLADGGSDAVWNLQLLTIEQHKAKTAREAAARAARRR